MFFSTPVLTSKAKSHKYYSISLVCHNYPLILAKLGTNAKCKKLIHLWPILLKMKNMFKKGERQYKICMVNISI